MVFFCPRASWANLGSPEFGREIDQASRWHSPITWGSLTGPQQTRAVRLFSVLKTACVDHGRIALLIQGFSEGLDIIPVGDGCSNDWFGNATTYSGNGFELLRQLTREFSLRSRSEALSLRASLMSKVFQPSQLAGRSSTQVSDVIRQLEVSCARFQRLVATLDARDVPGLGIADSDQLLLLVKSLPSEVRQYCLMHASGETYSSLVLTGVLLGSMKCNSVCSQSFMEIGVCLVFMKRTCWVKLFKRMGPWKPLMVTCVRLRDQGPRVR